MCDVDDNFWFSSNWINNSDTLGFIYFIRVYKLLEQYVIRKHATGRILWKMGFKYTYCLSACSVCLCSIPQHHLGQQSIWPLMNDQHIWCIKYYYFCKKTVWTSQYKRTFFPCMDSSKIHALNESWERLVKLKYDYCTLPTWCWKTSLNAFCMKKCLKYLISLNCKVIQYSQTLALISYEWRWPSYIYL